MFFLINISLVMGIVPFAYMAQSYVADHFAYLALVGLAVIVARGAHLALQHKSGILQAGILTGCALWIAAAGVLSVAQVRLWDNPRTVWDATLRINPGSYAAHNNYGLLLMEQGDLDKAEELFRKANAIAPGLDAPYLNLARVYFVRGDLDRAERICARALEVNPKNTDLYVLRTRVLRKKGRDDEAGRVLDQALTAVPHSGELHAERGLLLYQQGRESEGIDDFRRAISYAPFLPEPYFHLGAALLAKGDVDESIDLLRRAVKFSDRAETHNVLGSAYAHKGMFTEALAEFARAYELQPEYPGIRDNIANALMDMKKMQEAARFCAQGAVSKNPCSEDTLSRLKAPPDSVEPQ
jgi:tetratricopeptide (TPR) repeat protein